MSRKNPRQGGSPERGRDRALSILLSVAVHAVIVGALLWGWWTYRSQPSPPQTLAIQATVVGRVTRARGGTPAAVPAPPAPAAVPPPPPQPSPQALAQQRAAEQAAAQVAEVHAREAAAAKAAAEQAAQQQAAQQEAAHVAAEKAAAAKAEQQAEAQREADEAAEAARQAKLAAERKAQEEAKAKAEEKAKQEAAHVAAEKAAAAKAEQQREADLRTQMQAEERLDALQQGPAETDYRDAIEARIERAWNRPPTAQAGVKCIVHITQIPGGEITHVQVESCNGDDAVRQSVENAAYRASPLPAPPDPALFDPNITVNFAPDQ